MTATTAAIQAAFGTGVTLASTGLTMQGAQTAMRPMRKQKKKRSSLRKCVYG